MAIGKITGSVVADNTLTESNLAFGVSGQSAASAWATDTLKVNIIESDDSTAIQLNDSLNISGTLSANTIDVNTITSGDSSVVTIQDNLKVTGLSTDNAFLINAGNGTIGETSTLTVDPASNYLGINQTSPEVTLHMTGEGAQSAQIRMEQHNDSSDAPDIRTRKSRGTADSSTKNAAGDFIFRSNHERYNGSAYVTVGQLAVDTNSGNADRFQLTLTVSEDGGSIDAAQAQFKIDGNDSGAITFNGAYKFPTADGSADQILQTDGSGTLTFVDAVTASSTTTFTNKTFDANATGNSITNIEVADFASGVLDTDISSVSGSDDTIASAKAIKTYVDSVAGGTITLGDSASNAGSVDINGSQDLEFRSGDSITATVAGNGVTVGLNDNITVNQIGAKDSSDVSITSPLQLSSTLQVAGTTNLNGTTNLQTTTITENTTGDALLLTTTEDSSSAGPVITMKRNSGSPADADYLGQLKFKGENDADQEVVYAKITAKIQDASDGTEDGLIEFANKKAGSNVITARLRSDSLQLLNGTSLTVAGTTDLTGNVTMSGNLSVNTISSDDSSGVNINESKLYVNGSTVLTVDTADEPTLTTSAADVDHVIINDGGVAKRIALGNINVSSFNNDANYASAASTGFVNSTVTSIPISSDSTATDYSDDEPAGVGTATDTTDAFGVPLGTTFDNMEPRGTTQATDFGTEEAYVGA